jgi:hypothetical protein
MKRMHDWLLSLMGEGAEDITAAASILPIDSSINSILTKATDGVMSEVCSQRLVSLVLIMSNAACSHLAFLCTAGKEMGNVAIVVLDLDLSFEEGIDWGMPGLLGCS